MDAGEEAFSVFFLVPERNRMISQPRLVWLCKKGIEMLWVREKKVSV